MASDGDTGAMQHDQFERPEDAALSRWPAAAEPRVVSVDVRGDKAEVQIAVGPSYDYWVRCERRGTGWEEVSSANGPSLVFFNDE